MKSILIKTLALNFLVSSVWAGPGPVASNIYDRETNIETRPEELKSDIDAKKTNIQSQRKEIQPDRSEVKSKLNTIHN